jgi:hypothetical protein
LMERLQEEAKKEGGRNFTLTYPLNDPSTPAIKKILASVGWKEERPFILRCVFNVYLFNTPWIHHELSYPPGYEEFLWAHLTEEDRKELEHQELQQLFPWPVSPFIDEESIEPRNSLGLRYHGKIIGWCLTHRIAPDTIRYTSLFIQSSWQFKKLAMKLLIDSIKLHLKNPTPWAVFDVPLLLVHYSWVHLVKKRLAPYADQVIHFKQAWHIV